jgi:hypothetical protein
MIARKQAAQRDDVVLEMRKLELDALLGGEAAAHRHHLKTGVALGLDDAMPPRPFLRVTRHGDGQQRRNDGGRSMKYW